MEEKDLLKLSNKNSGSNNFVKPRKEYKNDKEKLEKIQKLLKNELKI